MSVFYKELKEMMEKNDNSSTDNSGDK